MKLLALETSGETASVALLVDGVVHSCSVCEPRRHGEFLLPMVRSLLADAGLPLAALDAIAFGRGPGAFTGLRLAVSVTQGLALGAGLGVIPISSLAALAAGVMRSEGASQVLAVADARIGEVYYGAYTGTGGVLREAMPEGLARPEGLPLPEGTGWLGAGSGFAAHGEALAQRLAGVIGRVIPAAHPHAQDVARLAAAALKRGEGALPPEAAQPVYLREKVAELPR